MTSPVYPLALKPDLTEAAERWEAYYAGALIDRPIVCVHALRDPEKPAPASSWPNYRERAFGDPDDILDRVLESAERIYYGGEAIPAFDPSPGPDAIAAFCGAELKWHQDSGDTNWVVPFVDDWEQALPLQIQEDNPLWQHLLALYRRGAERLAGKMLLCEQDLHTNMDLLSAIRGPGRLCLDLLDQPEMVDAAMESARAIFPVLWQAIVEAGRMDERGYCHELYSPEGAAVLQCDFSYMIGSAMFDRWVLLALEEEASLVKHAYYHWDGLRAVAEHFDSVCGCKGLHTLQVQPGAGGGEPIENIEWHKRIQARGKSVIFWGTPDELKMAHKELRPEKVMYSAWVGSVAEADALLKWFVENT